MLEYIATNGEKETFRLIGLMGVAVYVIAYAALQFGFVRGTSYTYAGLNALAASLVLVSLGTEFNLASALTQVLWIAISFFGIARLYYLRNFISFSGEDRAFIARKLPGLPNDQARLLINAGTWLDVPEGYVLTQSEKKNNFLYFIAKGSGDIRRDGEVVARFESGDYIGEVTCFSGLPATGSAVMNAAGRVLRIPVDTLRHVAPANTVLRHAVEISIADDLRAKLSRTDPNTFYGGYIHWPDAVPLPKGA